MLKQASDNFRYKRQILEENENSVVLSDRVNKLEEKLNLIIEKLESVENGTNKMTSHIDFINDIYNKVQVPLYSNPWPAVRAPPAPHRDHPGLLWPWPRPAQPWCSACHRADQIQRPPPAVDL